MITTIFRRLLLSFIIVLIFNTTQAQVSSEKLKAKWVVEKVDAEGSSTQAVESQKELLGLFLTFGDDELTVSKKTGTVDSVLKKGPYDLAGNVLTLGNDAATILTFSEKELTIRMPGRGVLYLRRL